MSVVWLITLALLPSWLLPLALDRPSGLILWWLYLSGYIPSIIVPAISLTLTFEKLIPLQLALLTCMFMLCTVSNMKLVAVPRIKINRGLFWSMFVLIWSACLMFVVLQGNANIVSNLASLFVGATEYTIRSDYLAQRGRALAYVVGQLGQALDPYFVAFGIVYRQRLCLAAGIVGQIVIFGLTGFKSVLFSTVFLVLLIVFLRRWRANFGQTLTFGLIALVLVCAAVDRVTDNIILSSLITRRTLAAPGLLTGFYFEHYSQVSPAGVGFRFAGDGPVFGPPQEIGLVYFGSSDIDANANLWAEGFADFGMFGIFAFTLFVGALLWLYDSVASRHNPDLAVLLAAMPAVAFSNTAPTTVLLTHGALAVGLLLHLTPEQASNCYSIANFDAEYHPQLLSTARFTAEANAP